MRLNRGTVIFFLVLVVIIAAGYVLMNSDDGTSDDATATPLVKVALFPDVEEASITALSLSQELPIDDTRPTPLPGADPLPTLTPMPDGEDAPTQTELLSIMKDADANWVLAEDSMLMSTSPVDVDKIATALRSIADAQAESFIPENGDYEQYGLDNPTYDISFVVEAADDTEAEPVTRRLRIGERSFDNLGFYAFLDDDSETVYIIASASAFQSNVLNLIATPPFAPTPTPVPPMQLVDGGILFSTFSATSAVRFSVTNLETGEATVLVKQEDGTNWAIVDGDPSRTVSQAKVTTALVNIGSIKVVSRTAIDDISTVGLDNPTYSLFAEYFDGRTVEVSLGDKDPTGAFYYSLVNDITDVILINAPETDKLLDLIDNPPYEVVETTPEATEPVMEEMTPEATESVMEEMTPEATESVMEEMTPEATESVMEEMTPEATEPVMEEATPEATETPD